MASDLLVYHGTEVDGGTVLKAFRCLPFYLFVGTYTRLYSPGLVDSITF